MKGLDYCLYAYNAAAAALATDLISLAKGRKAAGAPLRRITVQPHQRELLSEEVHDERTAPMFEMRRKLYAPLADIVEECEYVEPGIQIVQFGARMAERFLPDDTYWDIMRHLYWS